MAITHEQSQRTTEELAELVYRFLSAERPSVHHAFDDALPETQRGLRTEHELDYADFGLTVGLAYGIARGENPYESPESVGERAGAAATVAFERWGAWQVSYEQDRAARPVPDFYPEGVAR